MPLHEIELRPNAAFVAEKPRLDRPGTYGETKQYCSAKGL